VITAERPRKIRPVLEVAVIALLMLAARFFVPVLAGLMTIVPLVYFFVEGRVRNRSRSEVGLKLAELPKDLAKTWPLILLVAVVIQVIFVLVCKQFFPEVMAHIWDRVPALQSIDQKMVLTLLIAPLGEEIIFRGLFQERFSAVMKPGYAILLSSLIFALAHFAPGSPTIVAMDMVGVLVNSLVYGLVYQKTRNIYASYIAHFAADILAVVMLVAFF
jgi:membrane protease YdiL (CAAX protease family)